MIRVVLPAHLRTLGKVGGEVKVEVQGPVTQRSILDAIEAAYPMLRGTLRDQVTHQRRPFVRFFACEQDLSHEPADAPLPEAVASGKEPFLIVGAIAGGAESRAAKIVREVFESGRPLIYIRTAEEQRVGRVLSEVAGERPVWTWSLTEGMLRDGASESGTTAPRAALDFIAAHRGAGIFHLKDFHEPLRESAEVRRRLRDLYRTLPGPGQVSW